MDEKGRGQGVHVRKGGRRLGDRFDYDDQTDDYPQYQDKNFDNNVAAFLDDKKKTRDDGNADAKLPPLNPNLTAKDGEWQIVAGARFASFSFPPTSLLISCTQVEIFGIFRILRPSRWQECSRDWSN